MSLLDGALRIASRTDGEYRCEFAGDAWGRVEAHAAGGMAFAGRRRYWTLETWPDGNTSRSTGVQL